MSGANPNETCSADGRLISYFVVTSSRLASMTVLLFQAVPTFFKTAADTNPLWDAALLVAAARLTRSSQSKLHKTWGPKMRNSTRELPTSGYAIVVDGCVKTEFEMKNGVEHGARDLKWRLPMLQVRVYDAQARSDHEVHAF